MKFSILLGASALFAAAALPLGAQQAVVAPTAVAVSDSVRPVRTATIVVTAERVDDRERVLRMERGNRFLENELRKYDRKVVALESQLAELKQVAAKREAEIGSINSQRDAARVERERLEARLRALESGAGGSTASSSNTH